jgi:large subunit ribosomal protein L4
MDAATFTKSGAKATASTKLDKTVFGVVPADQTLVKLAYDAYLANGRSNYAVTKTRGLVSGGGKKPWKQKGTGNARVGSSRNPIWRGGGIAFGPTGEENYSKQMNVKAKRQAIRQALSIAAQDKRIKVIETFECKEGKVKETLTLMDKIGASRRILLVVSQKDELVERATKNLRNIKPVHASYVNVFDVMNADTIVMSSKSVEIVTDWLKKEVK